MTDFLSYITIVETKLGRHLVEISADSRLTVTPLRDSDKTFGSAGVLCQLEI
jgi:hypothetical protein